MTEAMQQRVDMEDVAKYFADRSHEAGVEQLMDITRTTNKVLAADMITDHIKKGAVVISVEGETDDTTATQRFERQSYLGRFVRMEMISPDFFKIRFTTRGGFFYQGTNRIREIKIENPLSKKGFIVPAKNGYRILDKGSVILVSRTGIFAQEEGYKQASRFLRDLSKERQRCNMYASHLEEAEIRLESLQTEIDDVYLKNVAINEKLRDFKEIRAELIRQRELADGMAKNLKSKVEYSQDVLEHQRRMLEEEVSKFSRYVSDVSMQLERMNLEDNLRATRSTHPMLSSAYEKQLIDKWKREQLMSDNEAQLMKDRINRLTDRVRQQEEELAHEEVGGYATEGSEGTEEAGRGGRNASETEGDDKGKGESWSTRK